MTSAVWSRNVNILLVISDKYTTFKPLGKTSSREFMKKVVPNSENPKVVFSAPQCWGHSNSFACFFADFIHLNFCGSFIFSFHFSYYNLLCHFMCTVCACFNINSRFASFYRCFLNRLKLIDVLILILHNLCLYYIFHENRGLHQTD